MKFKKNNFKKVLAGALALVAMSASVTAATRHTFANPLDVLTGNERAVRGGEPVVLIFQDDYYLFVSHQRGYWYSPDFQNWTYVNAPNYPGGVVSVVEMDGQLIGCSMNNKNVYRCLDAKAGTWEKCGELSSDRYGDANMFVDDDGRLYMYFGWSQIMPFQVVELDKQTFKEIGEPKPLFWSDIKNHGFEVRKPEDVIYSIFNGRREYGPEELPWIEGPYMIKHNGKYYLQYAAIGLEFISYSHGVYVSDSPMGPFKYSEHNPLTFKTSGFQVGAGHGSTFHDKKGNLWTICMIPAQYGEGGRGSELAIYPTAVDKQGVMYSNTALGDYPQYYPAERKVGGADNYVDWKLLSVKKKAIVSSTFENYAPANALDEDFTTCWVAETGDPGEYFEVDLGGEASINAIQLNWDHIGAARGGGMGGFGGFGGARQSGANRPEQLYQCYEVLVSTDGISWETVISKPKNNLELKHDYNEMSEPVNARYVKVVNIATYDNAKFSIKDLRIFGTTPKMSTKPVKKFMALRNPEDRREANLAWEPVPGADGYIVRYGIEKNKLYNSYIVYDKTTLYMHSLNTAPEYYFSVEAFDSGLDFYRENPLATIGLGAEIQLAKGGSAYRQSADTKILMLKEGQNEYVFDNIDPGNWVLNHSYGPVLWSGQLTEKELISNAANPEPTVTAHLTLLGAGTETTGSLEMKVIPGPQNGKVIVIIKK